MNTFDTEDAVKGYLLITSWSIGMFAAAWGLGLWTSGSASTSDVIWTLAVLFLPGCVFCYTPIWIIKIIQKKRHSIRCGELAEDLLLRIGFVVDPDDPKNTAHVLASLRAGQDAIRPPPVDPPPPVWLGPSLDM